MNARRFCSKGEIKSRAGEISFAAARESYRNAAKPPGRPCSCSPETGKFYEGEIPEDRKDLIELHGDGGPIYIIAPWSNMDEKLREDGAEDVCAWIVRMGHIPFIGSWYFEGRRCEEPSFAIDHGISEAEVRDMLDRFDQVAAYRVRYDGAETVDRKDL